MTAGRSRIAGYRPSNRDAQPVTRPRPAGAVHVPGMHRHQRWPPRNHTDHLGRVTVRGPRGLPHLHLIDADHPAHEPLETGPFEQPLRQRDRAVRQRRRRQPGSPHTLERRAGIRVRVQPGERTKDPSPGGGIEVSRRAQTRRVVTGGEPFGDLERRAEDLGPCLGGLSGSGLSRVEDARRCDARGGIHACYASDIGDTSSGDWR